MITFDRTSNVHSAFNIPSEAVLPGTALVEVEKQLPQTSLSQWREKETSEYIILIDWIIDFH